MKYQRCHDLMSLRSFCCLLSEPRKPHRLKDLTRWLTQVVRRFQPVITRPSHALISAADGTGRAVDHKFTNLNGLSLIARGDDPSQDKFDRVRGVETDGMVRAPLPARRGLLFRRAAISAVFSCIWVVALGQALDFMVVLRIRCSLLRSTLAPGCAASL